MLISQDVSGVSAFFKLERAGNEVTATYSYGLTGYYDEELGYYVWDGEIGANIGDDGDYLQQTFDRPMDLSFVATLAAGVAEDGHHYVNDWIGGAQFESDYKVVIYDTAASYGGSAVADYVFGSAFGDAIAGGDGNDNAEGAAGNDRLRGDAGDDTLAGGSGVDTLGGGAGGDRLFGGGGIDLMNGGAGDDGLNGGGNQDLLAGGAGFDSITGNDGNDTIDGGAQADRLLGGAGRDRFTYDFTSDSKNTSFGHDVIVGFERGLDVIDLHDVDAKAGETGNQDFAFIGTAEFSAEGQVRFLKAGGEGFILVNTSGNAIAEMAIRLPGIGSITDASFIL